MVNAKKHNHGRVQASLNRNQCCNVTEFIFEVIEYFHFYYFILPLGPFGKVLNAICRTLDMNEVMDRDN